MVGLDLGTRLIKVNMTTVRKGAILSEKPGIDFLLPDEKAALQQAPGGNHPYQLLSQHHLSH